jgi:mono/diheme cytochrome c family protein
MEMNRFFKANKLTMTAAGFFLLAFSVSLSSQSSKAPAQGEAAAKALTHGKYLVENVSGCGDCHTPFNEKGEPVQTKKLQGATLGFAPLQPVPNWAKVAPPIAGLPGWTDDAAIKFLMTGLDRSGTAPRPPMPPFRFSRSDAAAVVAYLRSLGPAKP